jgi:hypothetical protein
MVLAEALLGMFLQAHSVETVRRQIETGKEHFPAAQDKSVSEVGGALLESVLADHYKVADIEAVVEHMVDNDRMKVAAVEEDTILLLVADSTDSVGHMLVQNMAEVEEKQVVEHVEHMDQEPMQGISQSQDSMDIRTAGELEDQMPLTEMGDPRQIEDHTQKLVEN